MLTHMKTTLDLPDELLIEAKTMAARRRTTLKAIVEGALRRELAPSSQQNPDPEKFEMGPLGFLVLKRQPDEKITLEQIQTIQETLDEEDFRHAVGYRDR